MAVQESAPAPSQFARTGGPIIRSSNTIAEHAPNRDRRWLIVAWTVSSILHLLLLGLFWLGQANQAPARVRVDPAIGETRIEDTAKPEEVALDEEVPGLNPTLPAGNQVPRLADVVVPGLPDLTAAPGFEGAPDLSRKNVPPPPGFGDPDRQGSGIQAAFPGRGDPFGRVEGGGGGVGVREAFSGRGGSNKDGLLGRYGGTPESEIAVRLGMKWIARHQAPDGHWALDRFNEHGRCNCTGFGARYDAAATAFGLLPLLGAGETHLATGKDHPYARNVQKGVNWLLARQKPDGSFSGNMYEQGLATIALCEAYGLTSDPKLKRPVQRALDFICQAQSQAGGWRYGAREPGFDTSVGGWQLMALKSGQMAGLSVPRATLTGVDRWLNAAMDRTSHGYGYTSAQPTPTMTSVGLLCREYRGWGPRTPELATGLKILGQNPPGAMHNIYYEYYATQVLHHLGGPDWVLWNEGKDATGNRVHKGMRDWLVANQDRGTNPGLAHQAGSWSPVRDVHGAAGGRLMVTSLSLLTLEVYYRHLPLYRRETQTGKEEAVRRD